VQKIKNQIIKSPSDFLAFVETKAGKRIADNQLFLKRRRQSALALLIGTGYGWIWIDNDLRSHSKDFFKTQAQAWQDLKDNRFR
jgi:hypothetical protein